jgi:HK97 family phage prohead protease
VRHFPQALALAGLQFKSATDAPVAPAPADKRRTVSVMRTFEVKAIDEEKRTFSGLAAAFSLDQGGDVILKGAFRRTLTDWRRSKRTLPLLDSHNGFGSVRAVIGRIEEATETDEGLEITASVIEGPDGDEVYRRIVGKYVDGLSIGYRTIEQRNPTEEEARLGVWRYIKELALKEISVCIWPMNGDARIDLTTVKALIAKADLGTLEADELDELKQLHDRLTALLAAPAPTPAVAQAPAGLAMEDPRRAAMEQTLRDLTLRSLSAR